MNTKTVSDGSATPTKATSKKKIGITNIWNRLVRFDIFDCKAKASRKI